MINMNETQLELLKYAVTNHLNNLSLEEVQKIFNQNLDYSEIAHEYVYSTGLNEKGYHSDNDYGDLDKDKDWLIEQIIEGAVNEYDNCATLGELACQLGVDASPKLVDVGEPTKAPSPLEPPAPPDPPTEPSCKLPAPPPPPTEVIVVILAPEIDEVPPLVALSPTVPPLPTVMVYVDPFCNVKADSEEPPPPEASLLKEAL